MQPSPEREIVAWAQTHPVEWMRTALDAELWEMQRLIVESVRDNKRTAVRSCHGIGKSFLAAHVALWFLLCFPNALVATTAPTFRQVKKILWQEIGKATAKAERANRTLGGRQLKTEYIIAPGWYAFGFSADDPTSAQGLHAEHVLLIYDEASGLSAELWEALEGALTSAHCRLLSIGNPTDPNSTFAKEFKTPGTAKFAIPAIETPNFKAFGIGWDDLVNGEWQRKVGSAPMPTPWLITPEWAADKVKRWGIDSPAFRSRVKAEFPDLGDDTLIPLAWLERAQQTEYEPTERDTIELVSDIARFGGDEFTIGKKQGYRFRIREGHRIIDTTAVVGKIAAAMKAEKAKRVRIDGDGMGGPVVDQVRSLRHEVVEMHGGAEPHDKDAYTNARAEWFWTLRKGFEDGLFDIDERDEDLFGQLSNLKYDYDAKGRIQIESKKAMKKRGLPSPDRADTMAMAYAPAVKERAQSKLLAAMRASD